MSVHVCVCMNACMCALWRWTLKLDRNWSRNSTATRDNTVGFIWLTGASLHRIVFHRNFNIKQSLRRPPLGMHIAHHSFSILPLPSPLSLPSSHAPHLFFTYSSPSLPPHFHHSLTHPTLFHVFTRASIYHPVPSNPIYSFRSLPFHPILFPFIPFSSVHYILFLSVAMTASPTPLSAKTKNSGAPRVGRTGRHLRPSLRPLEPPSCLTYMLRRVRHLMTCTLLCTKSFHFFTLGPCCTILSHTIMIYHFWWIIISDVTFIYSPSFLVPFSFLFFFEFTLAIVNFIQEYFICTI